MVCKKYCCYALVILYLTCFWTFSTFALPTWLGVYSHFQRHDGLNPGKFTILANDDYYGLELYVGIRINDDAFIHYNMDYIGNDQGNAHWEYTPTNSFQSGSTIDYYFYATDTTDEKFYDSNDSQNYTFIAGTTNGGSSSVTRGPYLQLPTTNSMTIRWRTEDPVGTVVRYGTTQGSLNEEVALIGTRSEHEVNVTGLNPDTIYYYSIGSADNVFVGDDSDHFFVTAPVIGSNKNFQVWVLGDPGTGDSKQSGVRDAYIAYNGSVFSDFIITLGDNAYYSGTDNEFQENFFEPYHGIMRQVPTFMCYGNHDSQSSDAASGTGPYFESFTMPTNGAAGGIPSQTEAYYSFDYANVHFICLDTSENSPFPGNPMYTWLEQDLASNNLPWTIVYLHHSFFSKGSHDTDDDTWIDDYRNSLAPLLYSADVDLVIGGHSHNYERSYPLTDFWGKTWELETSHITDDGDGNVNGDGAYNMSGPNTIYLVAGNSGKIGGGSIDHTVMHTSFSDYGSVLLNFEGDKINVTSIDRSQVVRDSFTLVKSFWHGNHYQWPPDGQLNENQNLWINIESSPISNAIAAAVVYSVDGAVTWNSTNMTLAGIQNNHDWWHLNMGMHSIGTTVEYAIVIYDQDEVAYWNNNQGNNYKTTVTENTNEFWVGNIAQWPLDGEWGPEQDLWVNIEVYPPEAAAEAVIVYSTDGGTNWQGATMRFAGTLNGNDKWHLNFGKYPPGATFEYAINVRELGGIEHWYNNDGNNYKTTVLLNSPDRDNDGIPDYWEMQYGFDTNLNDTASDPDSDGMSNLDEYIAGTNPTDKNSNLRIREMILDNSNNMMGLSFSSEAGRDYKVEYTDNPSTTNDWDIISIPTPGHNIEVVIWDETQPTTQVERIYRMKVKISP